MRRVTLDTPAELEPFPGDFLQAPSGTCYLIEVTREVRRREPEPGRRRWALLCTRMEPGFEPPSDADVIHFEWYSRRRRPRPPSRVLNQQS